MEVADDRGQDWRFVRFIPLGCYLMGRQPEIVSYTGDKVAISRIPLGNLGDFDSGVRTGDYKGDYPWQSMCGMMQVWCFISFLIAVGRSYSYNTVNRGFCGLGMVLRHLCIADLQYSSACRPSTASSRSILHHPVRSAS
jgi:hypothetical protein